MAVIDILAFLIVFGLLAALVGTLATGVLRIVGFGVLVALALIIGTPYLGNGPIIQFGGANRTPTVESLDTGASPSETATPASNNVVPGGTGTATGTPPRTGTTGTFDTTGPLDEDTDRTQRTTTPTTGGGSARGIRAMW